MSVQLQGLRGGLVACSLLFCACGAPPEEGSAAPGRASGALITTTPVQGSEWSYVSGFSGVRCIDGSSENTLGIGVRWAPSGSPNANKLIVHVDGGGACFNRPSCDTLVNESYDFDKFSDAVSDKLEHGMFDRGAPVLNPVDDWNHVFIPYCTGDLHAGANPNGAVPTVAMDNGQTQLRFVGYQNMTVFLDHIVTNILPALGTNRRVIFTGESGGGWGVMFNAHRFKAMLPSNVTLSVVDDSAPLTSNATLAGAIQTAWRSTWNLGTTFLPACGAGCSSSSNWVAAWRDYSMNTNPAVRWGLVSANGDTVMRWFFGLLQPGCTQTSGALALLDADCYVSQPTYHSGVLQVRSGMQAASAAHPGLKTATFLLDEPDGYEEDHGWLVRDRFYDLLEGCEAGVCMNYWFKDIADDVATFRHVGP